MEGERNLEGLCDSTGMPLVATFPAALHETAARKTFGPSELWAAWKRLARRIGDFQARVLLTMFYFIVLAPFALIVRLISDPLALKPARKRGWNEPRESLDYTIDLARRQF
jgi:hypothetical protein